jgi:hypothetical protein
MSDTQLAKIDRGEIQQFNQVNPIAGMLQAITDKCITPESAAALEKMTELYLKVEAVNAKKAFASALAALQAELPRVAPTKAVPNNDGTTRYKFAPYEEIMQALAGLLVKHGFAISFSQRVDESRFVAICTLSHIGGHSENNEYAVRAGKGPPGSSESQADGAASSYAQRMALRQRFNIVDGNEHDDARLLGAMITPQQAQSLRERVQATNSNEPAFLRLAGSASFEEIRTGKYAMLDAALLKKEQAGRRGTLTDADKEAIRRQEAEEAGQQ